MLPKNKRSRATSPTRPPHKKTKLHLPIDPPLAPTPTPYTTIQTAFATFSSSLATLLSPAYTQTDLQNAIGAEPANLLTALSTMKSGGDLAWIPPPPIVPTIPAAEESPSSSWPPPLPPIHTPPLRQQAFTHRSYIRGQDASVPGVENRHYERLEFLGDAHLEAISSQILFMRFPLLREGQLSSMRQKLVGNEYLRQYAIQYNMHLSLREGKGQSDTPNEMMRKSIADVFEAYIGAIIVERGLENGMKCVYDWLEKLYAPRLKEFEADLEGVAQLDKMAKQSLYATAGGHGATLEYRCLSGNDAKDGYWFGVYLNGWGFEGRELGRGFARNKADAAMRAAMAVLARPGFREEMEKIKEKHLGAKVGKKKMSKEEHARVKEEQRTAALKVANRGTGEGGAENGGVESRE